MFSMLTHFFVSAIMDLNLLFNPLTMFNILHPDPAFESFVGIDDKKFQLATKENLAEKEQFFFNKVSLILAA